MRKLLSVEFVEETPYALFFNVTEETSSYWRKPKTETRRMFIEKNRSNEGGFWSSVYCAETGNYVHEDRHIFHEMILSYSKTKQK